MTWLGNFVLPRGIMYQSLFFFLPFFSFSPLFFSFFHSSTHCLVDGKIYRKDLKLKLHHGGAALKRYRTMQRPNLVSAALTNILRIKLVLRVGNGGAVKPWSSPDRGTRGGTFSLLFILPGRRPLGTRRAGGERVCGRAPQPGEISR